MGLKVDVRRLDLFNKMAKEGSSTVADHLSGMTGLSTEVRTTQINFLDIEDVKTHMASEEVVGIFVEMEEPPYGYVLFVLDPADSKRLARAMTGGMDDDTAEAGFTDMERSAIQEISNIMTSGFIDGWANVLETTIDISTPNFVYGQAAAIVDQMGGWPDSDLVFVIDSHILADEEDLGLTIYTFPQLEDLVDLIQDISLDTDVAADTTVSEDIMD